MLFLSLFFQQRGERDSQNQAVLTKLKCAAGKTVLCSVMVMMSLGTT